MCLGYVSVYYNEKKGYIIAAMARVKGPGFLTQLNPVTLTEPDISDEKLGELVRESLVRSRNSGLVDREDRKNHKFWYVSGIKSFSAFSRKYSCIDITEDETTLSIMRMYREASGAYVPEDSDMELPLDSSDHDLGNEVRKLLNSKDNRTIFAKEFDSVISENKVRYQIPSCKFIDIGDGHTDAYQIYVHENDENIFFGFMIDNGYQEISKEGIRQRWEQIYGDLENYKFRKQSDGSIKIIVSAISKTAYIKSYFWEDGEGMLEFFAQINVKNKTRQRQAEKAIKTLIDSVGIVSAKMSSPS